MHLDFETDDVDAEVSRLEAVGARRRERMDSFWIMEAAERPHILRGSTAD